MLFRSNKGGRERFDDHCVFANKVALKRTQVQYLNKVVTKKIPTSKIYVCTMKAANTKMPKAKMVNT